jgi:hypothetical protein
VIVVVLVVNVAVAHGLFLWPCVVDIDVGFGQNKAVE